MRILFLALIAIGVFSCKKTKTTSCTLPEEVVAMNDFVNKEIEKYKKTNTGITRHTTIGEEVTTLKMDTVDWGSELQVFKEIADNASCFCNGMSSSSDSLNRLVIKEWTTTDSLCGLQRFKMVSKNGKTELIEALTRTRSWTVDRDVLLSYQPDKGYRVMIYENNLWSKPSRKEIFAAFDNPDFLR
jgi:hypothetical protein